MFFGCLMCAKDIAKQHNLTVTGTFQFSDYIPKNINVMKKIVEETYKITRGIFSALFLSFGRKL
jgi:hypothetical protein